MTVGEKIKQARLRKGLNQSQLAARAGISQATINNVENGKRNPGLRTITQVAGVLDMAVEELIEFQKK